MYVLDDFIPGKRRMSKEVQSRKMANFQLRPFTVAVAVRYYDVMVLWVGVGHH